MQHQVKYTLHVSFDALDKAFQAIPALVGKRWHQVGWVESCDPSDQEEGERHAGLEFPNKRHPELTRTLFFQIMCAALPQSKHDDTGFFVKAFADVEKDGKPVTAVFFADAYQPRWERRSPHESTFWIKGEMFAEELQNKLTAIAKIAGRGEEW